MAKRTPKTSIKQYEVYVQFLEENKILKTGKSGSDKENLNKLWLNLTQQLNCIGSGPKRNVESWKKVFSEWKSVVRKKAREGKSLNDIEKNLLLQTGLIAVEGIEVEEVGLNITHDKTAQPDEVLILHELPETPEPLPEETMEFIPEGTTEFIPENKSQLTPEQIKIHTPSCSGAGIKRKRETTENVLLKEYQDSQKTHNEKMKGIAAGLFEIAKAINRYCDIVENKT